MPDWEIWALSVSASISNASALKQAGITLENAYVVYDAPEQTTTMSPGGSTDNINGTDATEPNKGHGSTPEAVLGTTFWIVIGVCGLIPDPCGRTTVVGFFKSADVTKVEPHGSKPNVRELKALVESVQNGMVELVAFGGARESHRLNTEAYRFKTRPKPGDWYDLTVQMGSVFQTPLVISATPADRTASRPGHN